jgi:4-amino-4-deoxy-L-arabinose transferase-like glycosyltransferase
VKESRRDSAIFWIVVVALFLITRIPAFSQHLTIDNVNLAFSLEEFDPRSHQPQPPGYPLFVFFARIVNVFFHSAEWTFIFVSFVACGLSLLLTFALGSRLFETWVGRAAVLLLLTSPPFWYASIDGPLRPFLALFSLLVAFCCWRCWNGERAYMFWGALALGVGSGFRPELGAYLFPLWLLSAWMGTRSVAAIAKGIAVLAVVVTVWLGVMAWVVGGLAALYDLNIAYAVQQSTDSVLLGVSQRNWMRQIGRLVVWNSFPMLATLWAWPIVLRSPQQPGLLSSQTAFLLVWLTPGLLFQALIHVADPGHTVSSVPVFCIIGGYLILAGSRAFSSIREVLLSAALVVQVVLFLGFLELPRAGAPTSGLHSLKNIFVFGTFETSLPQLRFMDATAGRTLEDLDRFAPGDRPAIIVTSDVYTANWFMNWRIARFYAPNYDIWVMKDLPDKPSVQRVRRNKTLDPTGPATEIPVPRGGRILWLLERDGPFHRALLKAKPDLPGGSYLSYTDVDVQTQPFQVLGFDFIPTNYPANGFNP